MPRLTIKHTAAEAEGQIYVPQVNWLLMVACVILVLAFQKSSNLAAAYGIAVTGTMGITSLVYFVVTRRTWGWSIAAALPLLLLFLSFDVPFFATNLFKLFEGGYVPIAIAAVLMLLMLVWWRGRHLLHAALAEKLPSLEVGLADAKPIARIPGCAIFMTSNLAHVPPTLVRHLEKNRVLHEHVLFVGVTFETIPYVVAKDRVETREIASGAHSIRIRFGYMEEPRVVPALEKAVKEASLPCDLREATYYVGRETILAGPGGKMGVFTESIFAFLQRNAVAADSSFGIPPEQVVEIGSQVDL
jgi:KUP system potassium uptake protein